MTNTTITVTSSAQLLTALKSATGGETILLSGDAKFSLSASDLDFPSTVTIASANPSKPATFETVSLTRCENIVIDSVKFDSSSATRADWLNDLNISASSNIALINSVMSGTATAFNDGTAAVADSAISILDSTGIIIAGNTIQNYYTGLYSHRSSNVIIEGNEITKLQSDGMQFSAMTDLLIKDNYLHDFFGSVHSLNHDDMIQFWTANTTTPSKNITITGNILDSGTGSASQGIFFGNDIVRADPTNTAMYFQNVVIDNNLVRNGEGNGIAVYYTNGLQITNNVVLYDHDAYEKGYNTNNIAIQIAGNAVNAVVSNNISDAYVLPSYVAQSNNSRAPRGSDTSSLWFDSYYPDKTAPVVDLSKPLSDSGSTGGTPPPSDTTTPPPVVQTPTETPAEIPTEAPTDDEAPPVSDPVVVTPPALDGSDGNDVLTGNEDDNTIRGFGGNDRLHGGGGSDTIEGGDGDDTLYGEAGDDRIYGGRGTDTVYGGLGNDSVWGGDDNDILYGEDGNDTIYGEAGDDLLNGGAGDDRLDGGEGNDSIRGGEGNDIAYGGNGNDFVEGDSGDDLIYGGAGRDHLSGGDGADTIHGDAGDDQINGGAGDDLVYGGEGNDTIYGGSGADKLNGGIGNDIIYGGTENDILYGDDGDDLLYGEDGDDTIHGGSGNDGIRAGNGNDTVFGGAGSEMIYGDAGSDRLFGEAGNDTINGGDGDDWLYGGAGRDTLTGGAGKDRFAFNTAFDGTSDTITDFNLKDDKIVLDTSVYTALAGKTLTSSMFRSGSLAKDANDYLVYRDGVLYYDADGNGKGAAVAIATLSNKAALTIANIELVSSSAAAASTATAQASSPSTTQEPTTAAGSAAGKTLTGTAKNDTLRGTDGSDVIQGKGGHDWLHGGKGADKLTGGLGNDVFVFDTPLDGKRDTITDFSGGDKIGLDLEIFASLPDKLTAGNFRSGSMAKDANDYLLYVDGVLYYDPDGNGAQEAQALATLSNKAALTHSSFLLL